MAGAGTSTWPRNKMETVESIKTRRSIRSYQDKEVPKEKIKELIALTKYCPSAKNIQPLKYIVVTSKELIAELSKTVIEEAEKQGRKGFRDLKDPVFYNAPAVIFIIAPEDNKWIVHDGSIAANTIMLAATDAGLGTCSIGYARYLMESDEARKKLGIPNGYKLVYTLTLGYPAEIPEMHDKKEPEITFV